MRRLALALTVTLASCSLVTPTPTSDVPPVAPNDESRASPAPAPTVTDSSEDESSFPSSIPLGATSTFLDAEGNVLASASSSDGQAVPWTSTESRPLPLPVATDTVETSTRSLYLWRDENNRLMHVRVTLDLRGLPDDTLFLELVPKDSEVSWANGTSGFLAEIWTQVGTQDSWQVDFLTSEPPAGGLIHSLRFSLDLHQATRVVRHEAIVGDGQSAVFDFGSWMTRWVVSGPSMVTRFSAGAHGSPSSPLYQRGLSANRSIRVQDANGADFTSWGGGGAGSQSISLLRCFAEEGTQLPVKVTVEVPQETRTTRLSIHLKEIVPTRQR